MLKYLTGPINAVTVALPPEDVVKAYYPDNNAYHNYNHVVELLGHFDKYKYDLSYPDEVFLAILFHDAVYDPCGKNKEELSAHVASSIIDQYNIKVDKGMVTSLIMLTALHGKLSNKTLEYETCLFLDSDMVILGSDPDRFDEYNKAIAEEYSFVEPETYYEGRTHFLRNLLKLDNIYLSYDFHVRYEKQARSNIQRALEQMDKDYELSQH